MSDFHNDFGKANPVEETILNNARNMVKKGMDVSDAIFKMQIKYNLSDDQVSWLEKNLIKKDKLIMRENFDLSFNKLNKLITLSEAKSDSKAQVKIKVKHSGILEIPEGKLFYQLPLKHYIALVNEKGYAKIIRALTNLETWNKKENPDLSKKASDIADRLKKKFRPEEKNK